MLFTVFLLAIKKKTWLSQRLSPGKGYGSLAVEEEQVGSDGRKTVTAPQGTQSPTAFEPGR